LSPDATIQHKPAIHGESGFAFENEARVGVTEFNFADLDKEADARDRDATLFYYREKLSDFVRFTCAALLSGNPTAAIAGRRAFYFAFALKQPPFETQAQLAKHLGVTPGRVSQELNAFLGQNPLLSQSKRESN
jgi:hypothetical protein